ncbi:group 10 secretory phospholipase A2 [Spea bombifrons]|uniref:group 10 secretory phospholipase A2 n=1 Tax=Spea bombifrons TaxID=233779 RepID=UPI002348FACF|nr:group 10 secretory phospholipase A2 [Spea bombifrons]
MEMKIVLMLCLYISLKEIEGKSHVIRRRGLVDLAEVIYCYTGRSSFAYIGYGCYCGVGGQGRPKDRTDWCCQQHDCCYDRADAAGCVTKMGHYSWTCKDNAVNCDEAVDKCQKMVCKCDREFGKCLTKSAYNNRYILYPDFLCGSVYPSCKYKP